MKKIVSTIILIILIVGCSFNTEISYRLNQNEEYINGDGYMIKCKLDHFTYGDVLIVGMHSPYSYCENSDSNYINAIESESIKKVISVNINFVQTNDTLTLKEIRKNTDYYFTSIKLNDIIENNNELLLKIKLEEKSKNIIEKEFKLTKHKHTYSTGTFPHG